MRQVAKFLEIEFRPSLLVEGNTGLEAMANQNSQFVSSSSLLRVTKGLSSTVIGSSLETLTKAETEVIANVFDGAPVDWPTADDIPEFQNFLENFVYRHREAIRKNSFLQKVKSAHTAEERMSLYSELNFGRANVDQAFVR